MQKNALRLYSRPSDVEFSQSEDTFHRSAREFAGSRQSPTMTDATGGLVVRSTDAAFAIRRETVLPRLIPVGPAEIADGSDAGRRHVIRRLAKALRGERARGRAGHWTYSLNRHIGLLQAFRAERAALRALFPTTLGAARRPAATSEAAAT